MTSYKLPIIIIASVLLLTGVVLLIVDLVKDKNTKNQVKFNPNINSSPSPLPSPLPSPSPSPVQSQDDLDETGCFYKNPIKCTNPDPNDIHNNSNNDSANDLRCMSYQMQYAKQLGDKGKGLAGELCAEIDNVEQSNPCYAQYQSIYSGNCTGLDPIVHGNTENQVICGQDCSNVSSMTDCYTKYLNSHNLRCEFGSKDQSGNFLQNCENDANSHGLLCNTAIQNACHNVLTQAPVNCPKK